MPTTVQTKTPGAKERGKETNRLEAADRPAHDWYRFVLSYPPHLVRDYVERFDLREKDCVLDPFCGTGTTVVECKKLGLTSIGIEAHPCLTSRGGFLATLGALTHRLGNMANQEN